MKILFLFLSITLPLSTWSYDCENCAAKKAYSDPEWPIEFTQIEKVNYQRNKKASFCKRPVEMVDTIVLHHSETPSIDTPERINDFHLQRGTKEDPWYMIAYSYTLNTPYTRESSPRMRVTEGRPLDIVGAHAGSGAFVPMNPQQRKIWDSGKIICGTEGGEFKVDPKQIKNGKIKANVTTIGLVVIGNYSPFSKTNPNGYPRSKPRYPTKATQDIIARTACQLQKKYPNMKNIKWHNYYHATSCPGSIREYVGQIKAIARNYGCEFN